MKKYKKENMMKKDNMMKKGKLKRLIEIGCIPTDSAEERLRKTIMTIMVIPYSLAGIIWGLYFMRNGIVISGIIPLVYAVVSLTTFFHFIYTKRYKIFCFFQVFLVLVLPFLLQLTLGGFSQSSGMFLWSCTAPFIALVFYDSNVAKKWFYALLFILVLACFLDESARTYYHEDIDENAIVLVYGANFILISALIFGIQIYFLNGMNKIKIKLKEKEELLKASAEIEKQKSLLSASKDRLELVMGSLEEVVWGRNLPDYQMQYVSNSVVKLYGFPMADWYENPNLWMDMIHPDDIQQVEKDNEPLFSLGVTKLEYRIITADKKIKWIHSATRIIKSTDGTPFLMTGIAKDITVQKNTQEQLNQLNNSLEEKVKKRTIELTNSEDELKISLAKEKELGQLKSSFISVASHQFRTPLAVIQSNAELLEMLNTSGVKQEPEKYAKVTNRITETISKMTYLMDDVLTLEKLTSGNVFYTPEDIDLVVFCEKLVKNLNFIQRDGRALDFVIDGEAYKLQLDANLLTHSLSNLISNAFNYSVGKGNPQLSIHFAPTEVILAIRDYGLGLTKEEQLHLFEPFFRADNVAEIKGTGLGLSIAKEYVEVNKGQISVKSILGEGSCFEITFKR
jgi:PAS domain S-box-containing protein